jgi:ABC-type glycerol-3-phosphate transport system substrate-binding protein
MIGKKTVLTVCIALVMMVAGIMPVFAQRLSTPAGVRLPNPPRSLRGMDIVIGQYWDGYDVTTYKPKNESEAKQLEYRKQLLETYNFRMRERMLAGWGDMLEVTARSLMAGRPAAHVFLLVPGWAMSLYNQNLLFPVNTARSVNFTGRNQPVEWNKAVHDVFTFGKNTYAFQAQGYGGSQHASVVFFNKRLFQEAGLSPDLLYDLQRNGQWTWDKFLEVCKQLTRDVNNDGIMDTYAMTADLSTEILDAFVGSNNAQYIDKDPATGKLVNATNRPEFLQALQFAIRLQREGVMMPRPEESSWDWFMPMFNDGRVAMLIYPEWYRQRLANMRDDWGVVVPPKGPNARDYVVYTDENVMVIPAQYTRDQVDAVLWAVQAWYAPVDANWRTALLPVFRDPRAVGETMAIIRDPARQHWKYYLHVPGLERGDIAWEMWWFDGEPAQLVESVSNSWNAKINDANPK